MKTLAQAWGPRQPTQLFNPASPTDHEVILRVSQEARLTCCCCCCCKLRLLSHASAGFRWEGRGQGRALSAGRSWAGWRGGSWGGEQWVQWDQWVLDWRQHRDLLLCSWHLLLQSRSWSWFWCISGAQHQSDLLSQNLFHQPPDHSRVHQQLEASCSVVHTRKHRVVKM